MSDIRTKSVQELLGLNFFIPSYQRGFRWTRQQVVDLLNDIRDFIQSIKNPTSSRIYCFQPLVVKRSYDNNMDLLQEIRNATSVEDARSKIEAIPARWNVIDGQQRLTTIYLILSYLKASSIHSSELYTIAYETRKGREGFIGSEVFLKAIHTKYQENSKEDNTDYFHMSKAYETIIDWFKKNSNEIDLTLFTHTLLQRVQFIWYETEEPNPIKVFTRLNIGKIGLTDSELIKALFLNRSNFSDRDERHVRLQQLEIASEWDQIEYSLQDDTFWLFIHETGYTNPTRIDFIFDLIREDEVFGKIDDLGDDSHKTFRYFDGYFKSRKDHDYTDSKWLHDTWKLVKDIYLIFKEWNDDCDMFHYTGFLINQGISIHLLLKLYRETRSKDEFIVKLKDLIRNEIACCSDLTRQYEINGGAPKTTVRRLLLLYNIQTILEQNYKLKSDDKYKLPLLYKFPFHLFKKESESKKRCGWEIEHIASNAGDLNDEKNLNIYIECALKSCSAEIKTKITKWMADKENQEKSPDDKRSFIDTMLADVGWSEENKNKLWNFTLLDSATNQEYQNSVFPFKRMCVAKKERGIKLQFKYNSQTNKIEFTETPEVAFVPLCTKNVFAKTYSPYPDHFLSWTINDAHAYLKDINEVLSSAAFIENQEEAIETLYSKATNKSENKL